MLGSHKLLSGACLELIDYVTCLMSCTDIKVCKHQTSTAMMVF